MEGKDFFCTLSELMWLDLQNNLLTEIPKTIAYHENLESFLLTNNNLYYLPNKSDLFPKLETFEVSENPLEHPAGKIILERPEANKNYPKNIILLHQDPKVI